MGGWTGQMDRADEWAEEWTGVRMDEWTNGVPTQQIHTRTLKLQNVETTEHRHILKTIV